MIVAIILITCSLPLQGQTISDFILPVDTPIRLAGTFGELRSGHFHTGVDFRTGGVEGKAVCSSANGWVSRVKISTVGFGVVAYVDHPQGYTTVYAHLHHLLGPLSDYVDSAQHSLQQYEVELFPDSGRFPVLEGQVLALSGNSGSSEGPHLHFEIRERNQQIPVNPFRFLQIPDTIEPAIADLMVFHRKSNHFELAEIVDVKEIKHQVAIPVKSLPDTIALAARMNDFDLPNLLGVYRVVLLSEGEVLFSFFFDSLNFNDGRYANAHSVVSSGKSRFHRLHRLPGNKSESFRTNGDGMIVLKDTVPALLKLLVFDFAGNADSLNFLVSAVTDSLNKVPEVPFERSEFTSSFRFDTMHVVNSVNSPATLEIPAGACYQDFFLSLKRDFSLPSNLSEGVRLSFKDDIPFHLTAKLTFSLLSDAVDLKDNKQRLVVSRWDDQGRRREVLKPDTISRKMVSVRVRQQGRYIAELDTIPPNIISWSQEYDPVDKNVYEVIRLSDDISGVASVNVWLNGRWVNSALDPRVGSVRWKMVDRDALPSAFSVTVTDMAGNQRLFILPF